MADIDMPTDFEAIQRLLDGGDLESAREILVTTDAEDEAYVVLRLKLSMLDGSIAPAAALQKLIQLMRRQPNWPGARGLFQEASRLAYSEGQSSVSHSHHPPPVRNKE
jgi:hypothetical protein